jgi:hypothetical protein
VSSIPSPHDARTAAKTGEIQLIIVDGQWKAPACKTGPRLRGAVVWGWPRWFHTMRASRQTELQRESPLHVVCSWLGNSPRIAQQSDLLVTEDDFAKAAGVAKEMM